MPGLPKIGTLESIALAKLMKTPEGISHLDFPEEHPLHNEEKLKEVIGNLQTGMYESDDDDTLKYDS